MFVINAVEMPIYDDDDDDDDDDHFADTRHHCTLTYPRL